MAENSSNHSFELGREWSLVTDAEFSVHNFREPVEQQWKSEQVLDNGLPNNSDQFEHMPQPTMNQDEKEKSASLPHPVSAGVGTDPGGTINAGHIYNSFPQLSGSDDGGDSDQNDTNIKTSLMSVWNNMKNGFTVQMQTNFKYDSPIWLLGSLYHCTREDREIQKEKHEAGINCITAMDEFKTDFASRFWFTYRKDFSRLPFSSLTTDMGWGCMLRSGQMMLAQALILHLLERDWRHSIHRNPTDCVMHKKILQLFTDTESPEATFSIHNLVKIGKNFGKNPGDWYGPSSVAFVLREAVAQLSTNPVVSNLCLYVAQDCTLYKSDLLELCMKSGSQGAAAPQSSHNGEASSSSFPWQSVIVLIPVRLGGIQFNPVYAPCLKAMLAHKYCIGIIGGKPKHSLYFVGWQEDKLIYLDPHFCQDFVDLKDRNFSSSFHCKSPRKLSFNKMDPSCTVGFYCKTKEDLELFLKEIPMLSIPPLETSPHPMFVFQDGRSEDSVQKDCDVNAKDRILKVQHYDSEGRLRPIKDSDDFVLL